MKLSAILTPMIEAGVPGHVILETVKAFEASHADALERRRHSDRERQAKLRSSRLSRDTDTGHGDTPTPSPIKEKDQKKINPTPAPVCVSSAREGSVRDEFEGQFWPAYPHKVGKPDAFRKFEAARRKGVALADILDGLDRYVRSKPADRPYCNPSTWLNQERWADAPAPEPSVRLVHGRAQPPPKPIPANEQMRRDLLGETHHEQPKPDSRTIEGEFFARRAGWP